MHLEDGWKTFILILLYEKKFFSVSLYLVKMDRKVGQAMSSGTVLYCSSLALNSEFKLQRF